MNPALLAVGIGCGGLVVLTGIVTLVGVFWLKGRVTSAIGTVEEIAAQEERIQKLDEKYPFTPPADGKPLRLEEKRLQDYLAIRGSLVPVFKAFEAKAKEIDARDKNQGIGTGLEALGMTGELIRDVRDTFAKELDAKRMSAKEFHTITGTIYASFVSKGVTALQEGRRESLEKTIAELDRQLASNIPPQSKTVVEKQREILARQLAELPDTKVPPADKAIYDANAALIEKYKEQIQKEANPALDTFLTGDRSGAGNALQPLQNLAK